MTRRTDSVVLIVAGLMLTACDQTPSAQVVQEDSRTAAAEVIIHPDFSGVWTNSSLTTLTRADGINSLVLSPAQAEALAGENFHNVRAEQDAQVSDPERSAPEKLDRLPPVGNYSSNWVDPGSRYARVKGEIRSSWIVDPADGQLPFTEAARQMFDDRRALRMSSVGPEVFSPGERCLLGFGGSGGPPMLNVLYNNFYRFVQTSDYLMILVEMVHDARIIPLTSKPLAAQDLRWLGNSTAKFEGQTLVITTSNFNRARAQSGPVPLSENAVVIERLEKLDDDTLFYAFEILDPLLYTQPVHGEMTFERRDQRVYEYACHEGNYAMGSMLRGARLQESEER